MHPAQGQGPKGPRLELSHQRQQILREVVLEQLNADAVDSRGTPIPLDVAERGVHEGLGDPSRQRMRLDLGHPPILCC
jgi:hypothetical protein